MNMFTCRSRRECRYKKGFGIIGIVLAVGIIAILAVFAFRDGKSDNIFSQQRAIPDSALNAVEQAEELKKSIERSQLLSDSKMVSMNISSSAFKEGELIPVEYTCDSNSQAGGKNPPLTISDVHPDAKSLVLLMDDPDAPSGTWVHWIVWNIDPTITEIAVDTVPENSVEGKTSFGSNGYGGPCPPSGTHRYFFKLFALDTMLNIPQTSDITVLQQAMGDHVLVDATTMGIYSRD
jgi:Raf kinase inhibitor-like YbhB/YbcL family protein